MSLWDLFGNYSQAESKLSQPPQASQNVPGEGGTIPPPHPWPVLHELNEVYQVGALPADDESGLVLYPAEGLLQSEKEAALRYAKDNLENLLHDLALEHLPRQVWLEVKPSKAV